MATVVEYIKLPPMGGAMRKRFLRLRRQGIPIEEAINIAKTPLGPAYTPPGTIVERNDANNNGKRRRNENTNSPKEQATKVRVGNDKTVNKQFKRKATYSSVAAPKVFLVPEEYPLVTLDSEKLNEMTTETKRLICDQNGGRIKPNFTCRPFIKDGLIVFSCGDKETVHWMKIQPAWKEHNLRALEEHEIPDTNIVTGYFMGGSEDGTKDILKLLQGQNHGITTSGWRELHRRNNKSLATIVLAVDTASMELLRQNMFILNFGFGATAKFYAKKTEPADDPMGDEAGAGASVTTGNI